MKRKKDDPRLSLLSAAKCALRVLRNKPETSYVAESDTAIRVLEEAIAKVEGTND